MNREELELLYSPSRFTKRNLTPEEIINHYLSFANQRSEITRTKVPCETNIAYGPGSREQIDIFGIDLNKRAPILVFFHGGYWQMKELSRDQHHFIAENLHRYGIKSIFVGYELCPDITLQEMVQRLKSSVNKCLEYAKENQSKGLYLAGHSAGAHLVSCVVNMLPSLKVEDRNMFKALFLLSGVYDLAPLIQTSKNIALRLNEETAKDLSPCVQIKSLPDNLKIFVIVGKCESPEFIKQSEQFYDKISHLKDESNQNDVFLHVVENTDHFNIIELLADEDFEISKLIVNVIYKLSM